MWFLMGFLASSLLKGFLASSLLGSPIFCTIVEKEYAAKDGQLVEVEKGKGEGIFTRFSDEGVWRISEINGVTFWVLEIEFGNGTAKTFFPHNPTDKDHPKICPKNKPFRQGFYDHKTGSRFGSGAGEFIQSESSNGWDFWYDEDLFINTIGVSRVRFWEKSDHKSYLAQFDYIDKEVYLKKKEESVPFWDKVKKTISSWF